MNKFIDIPPSRPIQQPNPLLKHTDQRCSLDLKDIKKIIHAESHIFIVLLGAVLGAIIALAIGYSIQASLWSYISLSLIPIISSYILREVYIYTLLNFQEN